MKNIFKILIIALLIASCTNKQADKIYSENMGVIPKPLVSKQLDATFKLSDHVGLLVKSSKEETLFTAKYLQERTNLITGFRIDIFSEQKETGQTIVLLEKSLEGESNKEAYQLEVTKDKIIISGEGAGLFYGVQTLLQIIEKNKTNKKEIDIPAYSINDNPRFAWRGMHLDESRHFFGVDEVKKFIDIMAMYKLNTFHWHLTDDQGWRIEIKSHPKLTEIGAWREGTGKEEWTYFVKPATEEKPKYGGFYTQDQIRDIIKYAQERFITIVPEIELPGHSWAALSAYPELSCSGKVWKKPNDVSFEFSDPFCVGNEETFQFFEDVFSEVIELFPSEYIHIGGDEAKKTPWEHCSKCQTRLKDEGLKNMEELQSYFIKRIEKIVSEKGRKIIGWEEIMEGGLPKEAVVMSWKGTESGIHATQLGYNAIMNPGQFTYMNKSQDANKPNAIGTLTLQDVYDYNPIPDTLDIKYANMIKGVQAAIWSEHVYSDSILEVQLLPRLTALSEVAWSDIKSKNWKEYLLRVENQFPVWDLLNVNYFISSPHGLKNDIYTSEKKKIELSSPYKKAIIRYTVDGSEPSLNSKEYTKEFYVTETDTIKAKTFLPSGKSSKASIGLYHKTSFLDAQSVTNLKKGINLKVLLGNISTLDDFSKLKKSKEMVVQKIAVPKDKVLVDFYGLEFNGYIDIKEEGIYTFYTSSDDGSRLYIDDQLIVDNDGIHGLIKKSGKAALKKGKHTIVVRYFQGNYGADLKIEMKNELSKANEIIEFYVKE